MSPPMRLGHEPPPPDDGCVRHHLDTIHASGPSVRDRSRMAASARWECGHAPPQPRTDAWTLSGTMLFDHVRGRFRDGIATLDALVRRMEGAGAAPGEAYAKRLDAFLASLVNMAKWLVGFLDRAGDGPADVPWTRCAVLGLRVDLHEYRAKVTRMRLLLRSAGVFQAKGDTV